MTADYRQDIAKLIEEQKAFIMEDKRRLGLIVPEKEHIKNEVKEETADWNHEHLVNDNGKLSSSQENKENLQPLVNPSSASDTQFPVEKLQNLPLTDRLDFNSSNNEGTLEESKQAFNNNLVCSDNQFTVRSDESFAGKAMLRFGEYSPNNPQLRVTAAPYLGIGEYEQRSIFNQRKKAEYLEYLKKQHDQIQSFTKIISEKSKPYSGKVNKYSQTDIRNIHSRLVQYELHSLKPPEREYSPVPVKFDSSRTKTGDTFIIDQSCENALLTPEMDKPKSILSNRRTGSPRDRYLSDLQHSYTPSFLDGLGSYQESRYEDLEREREKIKKETYQNELRKQIEEKRHMEQIRKDQEWRERELEERRLEQQLMRMKEEQRLEEQRRTRRDEQMRRHSEDLLRRQHELQQMKHSSYRKHADSESSTLCLRNTNVASKALSHYSPPVSRRNPYSSFSGTSAFSDPLSSRYSACLYDTHTRRDVLNRMDSLNTPHTYDTANPGTFSRYDSLSRIDSLKRQDTLNRLESLSIQDNYTQRRHSATQQDLSSVLRKSPKLQRRSSSSRFDDTLPIPVLKAHSPVARELKNAVPFNSSRHSSDALRKLEDKWQIPAVQKNILNHGDQYREGSNRSILTQLGAIRMQLQQEQLRMDETLRKRGYTQSKAVDFH